MAAGAVEALVLPEDANVSSARARSDAEIELVTEYRIRRANDGETRWIARRAEFENDPADTRCASSAWCRT